MTQPAISQQGQIRRFDALVIGSGIAGLTYALELAALRPQSKIALVTKKQLGESNSYYAQGGIAAALAPDDSVVQHVQDTLKAGDNFCNQKVVDEIVAQGAASIEYLLQCGVEFDRTENHDLARSKEAGHRLSRIYHCGDRTGSAVIKALTAAVHRQVAIEVFDYHVAVNLIAQTLPHQVGVFPEVIGAYILDERTDLIHTFLAQVVVLATGGAGKVYRYTTNPEVATGDGVAMAYRAGARVANLEFYQFHPTLLYHPQLSNFLLSETLRGEGAYLRLPQSGERFMQRYAPQAMELATRDIVARAIFSEMERNACDYVYLDIRHQDKTFLQKRFPTIYQTLQTLGLDLGQDLIPVVPAAHYMCGGILTDVSGRTDLKRMFAVGETTYTGLHGANRLASNSLLEGVVMGRNAAHQSCRELDTILVLQQPAPQWDSTSVLDLRRASQLNAHWRGLRGEMSSYAGIIRTEAGLRDQLKLLSARRAMIEEYYWKHLVTRDIIELRNIALVAELIVRSALLRKESRGCHYREDYPEKLAQSQPVYLKNDAFSFLVSEII